MSFSIGCVVSVRVDPTRIGPIIEILPEVDGHIRYRVFHGANSIATYSEDQLTATIVNEPSSTSPLPGRTVLPEELRAHLTAAVLEHPRTDDIYALRSARIQFIPFQFRPLTRLLRAERPRLLIADEVGVGKTIEAGLILKELSARGPMETVLIACPKALTIKWQKEMRRFDEHFKILDAASLKRCLKEAHEDGAWPAEYSRVIVHYELLRIKSYIEGDDKRHLPGLLTLDPAPFFNLVIADEAHHLRTIGTRTHQVAEYLAEVSEALILLSATPLQLSSKDLFTLLNLLRPEVFQSHNLLQDMIEPNAFLTKAAHHLRKLTGDENWAKQAIDQLNEASQTPWGARTLASDPRLHRVRAQLTTSALIDDETRVSCLREVEELNTLAHIMNRTRRRDIGRFTTREPQTIQIDFTTAQRDFYTGLLAARKDVLSQHYDPVVVRLILDGLERQASSCLPALARSVDQLIHDGKLSPMVFTDDPADMSDTDGAGTIDTALAASLIDIGRLARELPAHDPKFAHLEDIITSTMSTPGPRKLLLFSFFLGTLDYLAERLSSTNLRVGLVTGRVPDEDRESLRYRFSLPSTDPDALDLILSSEVGCEGLDYQFCDRMVNYDIPWNPMRVEQRIGRIDRFGQQSEKILIYNFVTTETVEERIFFRCWERLGIFKNTIGDLESVLGETTEKLTQIALNASLSPEQAAVQAQQVADNALRLAEETRRFEETSPGLLSFETAPNTDEKLLEDEGRFVTPSDVELLVTRFLSREDVGGTIRIDPSEPGLRVIRVPSIEQRKQILGFLDRSGRSRDRAYAEFARWTKSDNPTLRCTFDQKTAAEHRDVTFVTPIHPLVRAAVHALAKPDDTHLAAHVEICDPALPEGTYLFAMDSWEIHAVRAELRTSITVLSLDSHITSTVLEQKMAGILSRSQSAENSLPDVDQIRAGMSAIESHAEQKRRRELDRIAEENSILLERRIASITAQHDSRIATLNVQITEASNSKIQKMRNGQRDRLVSRFESDCRQLEDRRATDIFTKRLCIGVLEVRNDQ